MSIHVIIAKHGAEGSKVSVKLIQAREKHFIQLHVLLKQTLLTCDASQYRWYINQITNAHNKRLFYAWLSASKSDLVTIGCSPWMSF